MKADPTNDETHRRRYADAIRAAHEAGPDAFQRWFNRSESESESFRQGYWDFSFHILTRPVCARLGDPGSLTALEIGCGGGRLLNAAASFFGAAVGIDVHDELDTVRAAIEQRGHRNVTVLQTDGTTIPVADGSVDFVYSFIVLQHLPRYDVFVRYLHETHRVLADGGVAQLYFGRLHTRDPRRRYREIESAVNHVSLEVSPRHTRALCRSLGFTVVDSGRSFKRVPSGYPDARGGQASITLVKAAQGAGRGSAPSAHAKGS